MSTLFNILYEILVPTVFGDTLKPISTKHHKNFDKEVQKITGGLTVMSPAKGKWIYEGKEYPERILPVRIMVEKPSDMDKIVQFALKHYRQKAVMFYMVSNDVHIVYAHKPEPKTGNPYNDDPWLSQRYYPDGTRI